MVTLSIATNYSRLVLTDVYLGGVEGSNGGVPYNHISVFQ